MTTDQLIQKFQKIDKNQKILKLQETLNILKDKLPIFEDMVIHLQNSWNAIDESILISYYTIILKNAEYLENKQVTQYQKFMQKLRKEEEKQYEKDEIKIDNDFNEMNLDTKLNQI